MCPGRFERILEFDNGVAVVGVYKPTPRAARGGVYANEFFHARGELS
jgi:hypothetical protein